MGEAAEADLLREYQVDIYDVLAGRFSPRRVLALLRGLPSSSTTQQILRAHVETLAVRPELDSEDKKLAKYIGWGRTDIALAQILNQLVAMRYEMRADKKARKPDLIEIPHYNPEPKLTGISRLRRLAASHAGDH